MIRLIATDLDGTFLDPAGQVTDLNEAVLRRAHEMGVLTVFATGRPARWLDILKPLADINPYAVASNGAIILRLSDDHIIHQEPIPADLGFAVASDIVCELGNKVGFAAEYHHSWGLDPIYYDIEPLDGAKFADLSELVSQDNVLKILVRGFDIPTDRLFQIVEPIVGSRLKLTFSFLSENGLLELSAPGVSKASALRYLMNLHQISPSQLAAFGDMPNDREMLDLAGYGYSMAKRHHSLDDLPTAGDNADSAVGRTLAKLLDLKIDNIWQS